jgi:hypothetical protein
MVSVDMNISAIGLAVFTGKYSKYLSNFFSLLLSFRMKKAQCSQEKLLAAQKKIYIKNRSAKEENSTVLATSKTKKSSKNKDT